MLLGHRQAVAWLDDWHGMTLDDVREYEKEMQQATNERLHQAQMDAPNSNSSSNNAAFVRSASVVDQRWDVENESAADAIDRGAEPSTPGAETATKKGWFSWSW